MPAETLNAWMALYAGVGVLVAMCAVGALIKTVVDLRNGTVSIPLNTWGQRALALPKIWLRFNLNYLSGAPVILAIAIYFASHIGFAQLGHV